MTGGYGKKPDDPLRFVFNRHNDFNQRAKSDIICYKSIIANFPQIKLKI